MVLVVLLAYLAHSRYNKCMAADVFKFWNCFTTVLLSLQFSSKVLALSSYEKARRDIECYDCLTYNEGHYCADPFNKTSRVLSTVTCDGYCAKWVREIRPGLIRVKRTCSSRLHIQMTIHLVCMDESRPGNGHICFCNKPRCNKARKSAFVPETVILLCLFTTFILPLILFGQTFVTGSSYIGRRYSSSKLLQNRFNVA